MSKWQTEGSHPRPGQPGWLWPRTVAPVNCLPVQTGKITSSFSFLYISPILNALIEQEKNSLYITNFWRQWSIWCDYLLWNVFVPSQKYCWPNGRGETQILWIVWSGKILQSLFAHFKQSYQWLLRWSLNGIKWSDPPRGCSYTISFELWNTYNTS